MNKILPAGLGGHAVILSCCTEDNLTYDIFVRIQQLLSSSRQKHSYSTSFRKYVQSVVI